jgi:hypothetical protein
MKAEYCRNCGETADKHQGSQCPPDFDGCYLPPYATEIEIKRIHGGMLPERGARN